ncbi:MAG: ScyD/ScyE family protein [Thermomicrobiales bacterium]
MGRFGRRRFVGAGAAGLGLGALSLGGYRAWRVAAQDLQPIPGTTRFVEPPVRASRNGLLETTFEALPDISEGLGKMSYEGSIPGPTLRVQPGDRLKLRLINNLGGRDTNLHTHGMHVSPSGNSDNIFIHVPPGDVFDYEYAIPANHPAGLYWYHPHVHGNSNDQVSGGLAGAIIVEGGLDDIPGIRELTERLLILQGPFVGAQGAQYWLNGQPNPVLPMRPGETQRWRVLNASANAFYNLALDGHQFHWIASDGTPLARRETVDRLLIGPGERAEILLQAGAAGVYELRSATWGEGAQGQPGFTVATLVVDGVAEPPAPLPDTLLPFTDLGDAQIARRREITFQMQAVDPVFSIDGKGFDPDRIDQTVELDTIEEWVVRNDSDEWHPFHIHVNDYQVMSINGQPQPPRYDDTTAIPPHGEIVIRIPFSDFTGKFVYHCHILVHEDFGMMAVVEVVDPAGTTSANGVTVVATGLSSPRGMAWDDTGALLVAQSGTGDTATSTGAAASLVRIDGGCPVAVASGLPSSLDPFRDVMGPEDVAIVNGQVYVLQGATGALAEMDPATPNGVYVAEADGSLRLLADLTAWILANPVEFTPDHTNELGEPYRMQAGDQGLWVLESNRGELLWVELDGRVSKFADLSEHHPVWTALTVAPDGSVLAGALTPNPHTDASARVVRIAADGVVSDVWTGLTTVTGLAHGPDGALYALEMATGNPAKGGMPAGTGRVVRQTGPDSHEVVITGLEYPIALELGPDGGLYVALPSYGPNAGAGAIIRIDPGYPQPMAFDPGMLTGARCPEAEIYQPPQSHETAGPLAGDHDHAATPVASPGDLAGAVAVSIHDLAYDPTPLQIAVGTTVAWTNNDPVPHTATATDGSFDTGTIAPGETASVTFSTPGSIAYVCLYHPTMSGIIEVS